MKIVQSLLLAGMGFAVLGSQVGAAEYFVQPLKSGPVVGAALGAISLQAAAGDAAAEASAAEGDQQAAAALIADVETTGESAQTVSVPASGQVDAAPAASPAKPKWVSARKRGHATGVTSSEPTLGVAPATTDTSASAPATTSTGTTSQTNTTTTSSTTTTTAAATAAVAPTSLSGPAPTITAAQTYKSLDLLLQSGKLQGGDRVFLLDGYHGAITITGQNFTSPVLITAMPGQVAQVDSIVVRSSSNIVMDGLKVWTSANANGLISLIRSYNDTSDLVFTNLDVRSVAGATNYRQWTIADWNNNQRTGIMVDGQRQTVSRNRLTGVFNGITGFGPNLLIEENIVDGFSGDGMRALGDNAIVRRNKVQNCYQTTATHIDGFQAWTRGPTGAVGTGTIRNFLIEDNKMLQYVGTPSPFQCKLQGISLFAGAYDGFIIRNNVVSTTAFHGIAIAAGMNTQIVNNTVIHAQGLAGQFPWIRVSDNRDGRKSYNVVVANNIATSIKATANTTDKISVSNNVTVTNATNEFTSFANQDFTLRSTSTGVDAGAAALAPNDDITGALRPKGKAPDAGAYESF